MELAEQKKLSGKEKKELMSAFARAMARAENVHIIGKKQKNICVADPDDDKFIWCAIEGNADTIISADKDLLNLDDKIKKTIINKNGKLVSIKSPEDFYKDSIQQLQQKLNKMRL